MPRRTRQLPSDSSKEETRDAILRAAHHLFMSQGYHAVSTRQIADASGVTQPALYHHFADKQDLYMAVLNMPFTSLRVTLERIAQRNDTVEQRLIQAARFLVAQGGDYTSQMFHDIDHVLPPNLRQQIHDRFATSVVTPLAAIFEYGIAQGALRSHTAGGTDPHTAALLLLTMLQQLSDVLQITPPGVQRPRLTQAQQADLVVRVLLHGLAIPQE